MIPLRPYNPTSSLGLSAQYEILSLTCLAGEQLTDGNGISLRRLFYVDSFAPIQPRIQPGHEYYHY